MDAVDVAILREFSHPGSFQWDVRLSYASIGRAVGVDEETVRVRVRRLQERGVIGAWDVAPNPSLLGRDFMRVSLGAPPSERRAEVVDALQALDGARYIFEYFGGGLAVVLYAERGPARQRALTMLGALAGPVGPVSVTAVPEASVVLDAADWDTVRALRRDPRRPMQAIADEVGRTERTVRRRVDRLVQGKAVFLDPVVDLSRVEGSLPSHVRVTFADVASRRVVDDRLRALPSILFSSFEETVSRVSFAAAGVSILEDLRKDLEAVPGVAQVDVELTLRRMTCRAWLDEEVQRRCGIGTTA